MNGFGNGAIALTNVSFTPPPILICFCDGAEILTQAGYRKVETLQAGDLVLTAEGEAKPIVWIGRTGIPLAELLGTPERWPVCIPAHAIDPGVPFSDLYVSPQHRVALSGFATQLLFGEEQVLVAAKHLVGSIAERVRPIADVTYHHILLETHDMVMSNGLASESLQLSLRTYAGMSCDARRSLSGTVPDSALQGYFRRPDGFLCLKSYEAKVLAGRMAGTVTRPSATVPQTLRASR